MTKKELTVQQYSELKGIPKSTIYKQISKNQIQFKKVGSVYIILT